MDAYTFRAELYLNYGIAIQILDESGMPYCTISVNIPGALLKPDEFCVSWDCSQEDSQRFLATDRFKDTGLTWQAGNAVAQIWHVICPDLLMEVAENRAAAHQHKR